jgi:FkbM family methyltransferase
MHGATGNYYVGLMDYQDMSFVLHALHPGDLFVDVGANVGSYSICAASVGADVLAIEPIPALVAALRRNVEINGFQDRVRILAQGLGAEAGTLDFTVDADTTNRVATPEDTSRDQAQIAVVTLDEALEGRVPRVIKIDVLGYEADVLAGGSATLQSPELEAVVVEINGLGADYGHDVTDVDAALVGLGFSASTYDPQTRALGPLDSPNESGNTIYVRTDSDIAERLRDAPPYSVLGVDR